jgi:hypothetical protein
LFLLKLQSKIGHLISVKSPLYLFEEGDYENLNRSLLIIDADEPNAETQPFGSLVQGMTTQPALVKTIIDSKIVWVLLSENNVEFL